jgi:hypothetical protein
MTQEFKPGDRAMVVVCREDRGWFHIETNLPDNAGNVLVPPCSLHPLPTPDPLTELERRVVAACAPILEFMDRKLSSSDIQNDAYFAFNDAVSALEAARAPKDPVAELRAAWTDWNAGGKGHRTAYQRLERAITALEAKEIK